MIKENNRALKKEVEALKPVKKELEALKPVKKELEALQISHSDLLAKFNKLFSMVYEYNEGFLEDSTIATSVE